MESLDVIDSVSSIHQAYCTKTPVKHGHNYKYAHNLDSVPLKTVMFTDVLRDVNPVPSICRTNVSAALSHLDDDGKMHCILIILRPHLFPMFLVNCTCGLRFNPSARNYCLLGETWCWTEVYSCPCPGQGYCTRLSWWECLQSR